MGSKEDGTGPASSAAGGSENRGFFLRGAKRSRKGDGAGELRRILGGSRGGDVRGAMAAVAERGIRTDASSVKARIVAISPERVPLYAGWLAACFAEVYSEMDPDAGLESRLAELLSRSMRGKGSLLLVSELVDPAAPATATAPAGYVDAAVLLAIEHSDPILGGEVSWLRLLYTRAPYRSRGLASAMLARAEEVLRARGVTAIRADVVYGDDAVMGVFERRGYVRGRMALGHTLLGDV
ncbi:MAG: GNAT family N-acetyltransferase [Planctomycetes bacterium]|nr:GNAT family N-acetyltransferase [Planctomycetota bacterium]